MTRDSKEMYVDPTLQTIPRPAKLKDDVSDVEDDDDEGPAQKRKPFLNKGGSDDEEDGRRYDRVHGGCGCH